MNTETAQSLIAHLAQHVCGWTRKGHLWRTADGKAINAYSFNPLCYDKDAEVVKQAYLSRPIVVRTPPVEEVRYYGMRQLRIKTDHSGVVVEAGDGYMEFSPRECIAVCIAIGRATGWSKEDVEEEG